MDWIKWADDSFRASLEELRIWRERHPREVEDVAEEARAKVEGREPNYGPSRAYG